MTYLTCIAPECTTRAVSHGRCPKHLYRWQKYGSFELLRPTREERFWAKVDKSAGPSACWEWQGGRNRQGYGTFAWAKRVTRSAHRTAFVFAKGAIPDGLYLDHLCRNPPCVNPDHLEPVTNRENLLRGVNPPAVNARKTHCKNGHAFTPDNTYRHPTRGGRYCRICKAAALRAWKAAHAVPAV